MTTTRRRLCALTLATLALAGCAEGRSDLEETVPAANAVPAVELPTVPPGGEVLFNHMTQRLLAFDPAADAVVSQSDAPNFLQYAFPTRGDLYTAGDGSGVGFRVVRVRDHRIETLLELPDGEGVFPLAADEDRVLLLHTEYDDQARQTSERLVALVDGELRELTNVRQDVDRGAILDGVLHFTALVPERGDYDLWSVALDSPTSVPQRQRSGLPEPGLHVHDGRLFTSTGSTLVSGDSSFECADLCWFHDDLEVLLRLRLTQDAVTSLDVIDTTTGAVRASLTEVLDYKIRGTELVVYRTDGTETIDLRGTA